MHKGLFLAGAFFAGTGVIAGAFGAHALKKIASPDTIAIFETAVRYQFYHAIGLLVTALLWEKTAFPIIRFAGYFFIAGILLFSGSLYLMTALKVDGTTGMSGIGMITPFGGLFFIAGWIFLFISAMKVKKTDRHI